MALLVAALMVLVPGTIESRSGRWVLFQRAPQAAHSCRLETLFPGVDRITFVGKASQHGQFIASMRSARGLSWRSPSATH